MKKTGWLLLLFVFVSGPCIAPSTAQDTSGDPLTGVFKKDAPPRESLLPEGVVISEEYRPAEGDPIGSVAAIKGRVFVIHPKHQAAHVLEKKAPLFSDDMLVSGEKGRVHLKFDDGSFIHMGSHTKLVLDHAIYNPSKKTRDSLISLLFGKARFIISKLAEFRDARFNVKTPTAVAGVRGSDFAVAVDYGSPLVTTLMTGKDTTVFFSGDKPPAQVVGPMSVSRSAAGAAPTPPAGISVYDIAPFEIAGTPNWVYWTVGGGATAIAVGAVALSGGNGDGDSDDTSPVVASVTPPEGLFNPAGGTLVFDFSEDMDTNFDNFTVNATDVWPAISGSFTDSRTFTINFTGPFPTAGSMTVTLDNFRDLAGNSLSGQTAFNYTM